MRLRPYRDRLDQLPGLSSRDCIHFASFAISCSGTGRRENADPTRHHVLTNIGAPSSAGEVLRGVDSTKIRKGILICTICFICRYYLVVCLLTVGASYM